MDNPEQVALTVAEHMGAAADPDAWQACFCAALDEGLDVAVAMQAADEIAGKKVDAKE